MYTMFSEEFMCINIVLTCIFQNDKCWYLFNSLVQICENQRIVLFMIVIRNIGKLKTIIEIETLEFLIHLNKWLLWI